MQSSSQLGGCVLCSWLPAPQALPLVLSSPGSPAAPQSGSVLSAKSGPSLQAPLVEGHSPSHPPLVLCCAALEEHREQTELSSGSLSPEPSLLQGEQPHCLDSSPAAGLVPAEWLWAGWAQSGLGEAALQELGVAVDPGALLQLP